MRGEDERVSTSLGKHYEVFTAGEELFRVGDELLTVTTAFDRVYVYCACM